MKDTRYILVIFILSFSSVCHSQHLRFKVDPNMRASRLTSSNFERSAGAKGNGATLIQSLPAKVTPLGLEDIGIQTLYPYQSNGRALHNIQIDPDDPNKIHVVIVGLLSSDPSDSIDQFYPSRICFYSYSSDGGATWTKPVIFGSEKTGFPDLQLIRRNGQNVPIIAAHRWLHTTQDAPIYTGLWIEMGAPGDGKFGEYLADRMASDGSEENLIWPSLAISPDGKKAYVLSAPVVTNTMPGQLEFGSFSLSDTGARFDGWISQPGSSDPNYPAAGASNGGACRLRVSPSGKIGAMWLNADPSDNSIYYEESTDGGKSWQIPMTPLVVPQTDLSNSFQLTPAPSGLDFFFDGETPAFTWMSYDLSPGVQAYYPNSGSIFFQRGVDGSPVIVVSNMLDSAQQTLRSAYVGTGGSVDPQGTSIDRPTIARTADPKRFRMYYQVLNQGDSADVGIVNGSDTWYMFSSLYYQETRDGGATWETPQPLKLASETNPETDYRQPSTSDFNTLDQGALDSRVLYIADALPGWMIQNGLPAYSTQHVSLSHKPIKPSAVDQPNLSTADIAAYPNPFAKDVEICYSLRTESMVRIQISDILGRNSSIIRDEQSSRGDQALRFDGSSLTPGMYQIAIDIDGIRQSLRVVKIP